MDQEIKITLINKEIPKTLFPIQKETKNTHHILFNEYLYIIQLLQQHQQRCAEIIIYDITNVPQHTQGHTFPVNDHINRIGTNPFIGNQQKYNIDFINVNHLYKQHPEGIITNSCGNSQIKNTIQYPSTHLANIAIIAHTFNYKITGFLINV